MSLNSRSTCLREPRAEGRTVEPMYKMSSPVDLSPVRARGCWPVILQFIVETMELDVDTTPCGTGRRKVSLYSSSQCMHELRADRRTEALAPDECNNETSKINAGARHGGHRLIIDGVMPVEWTSSPPLHSSTRLSDERSQGKF